MKLNIDLGYIFKRLIVIGLGFILISQLKSCDVFALEPMYMNGAINSSCRGLYPYDGSYTGTIGTTTYLSGDFGTPYFYCKYSNYDYTISYKSQLFLLNRGLMGSSAPSLDPAKKYRLIFYVFTAKATQSTPSNLTQFKIIQSGVAGSVYASYSSAMSCNVELEAQLYTDSLVNMNRYKVTCDDFSVNTSSWQNLYLYADVDAAGSQSGNPWLYLVRVSDTAYFEEYVTIGDIQNDLNDSDVTQASENGNSIFDVDENGQSTNPNVSNYGLESVITAPIQIIERATDVCSPLSFTIFQKTITLPCGDTLFWNRDFSSQSSIFSKGVSGSGLNSTRDTFRAFWNLFFGGAIIFHLLTILYEVCQKAIDPFDDTLYTISDSIDARSKSSKVVRDTDGDSSRFTSDMNSIRVGGLAK